MIFFRIVFFIFLGLQELWAFKILTSMIKALGIVCFRLMICTIKDLSFVLKFSKLNSKDLILNLGCIRENFHNYINLNMFNFLMKLLLYSPLVKQYGIGKTSSLCFSVFVPRSMRINLTKNWLAIEITC